MRTFILYILIVAASLSAWAISPVEGISPSGTLPIIYVNTKDATPIDQKETYIDATYWLDASMSDKFESIATADAPLALGIRGRGNASWKADGQKPYKLKLDKKAGLLGMAKNKHWALLAKTTFPALFNEPLGFELGRRMGMSFVPAQEPVELVLNGTYMGLYYLTETVRVDANRVNIFEQPDLCEDPEVIPHGWLVELDNYEDPYQVVVPMTTRDIRVTHKTPEVTNQLQDQYLIDQWTAIINAIQTPNKLDRTWEEYLDMESMVKFYLVSEIIHNCDAFHGSTYLHKDIDSKWTFGPLWDLNWSLDHHQDKLLVYGPRQAFLAPFYQFPAFRKRVKEVYDDFMSTQGLDWVEPFLEDLRVKINKATVSSAQVWPYQNIPASYTFILGNFRQNIEFLNSTYAKECVVYNLSLQCTQEPIGDIAAEQSDFAASNGDDLSEPQSKLLCNNLEINQAYVLPDMGVDITVAPAKYYLLDKLYVNDKDCTSSVKDGKLHLAGFEGDTHVRAHFVLDVAGVDDIVADDIAVSVSGRKIIVNATQFTVYDTQGRLLYSGTGEYTVPTAGIYIVSYNNNFKKVSIQ